EDRGTRSVSAEVRPNARSLLRGPPFSETPDEGVKTEEQDPGREDQLDPWCDAGDEEQDERDRVAGEREPEWHETGTNPDRGRRDGEHRGHPHRVGVQDHSADPAAEPRNVFR